MSKTAGFNDQVFVTGETANVDRSLFDLSYSNTFTLNEGLLAPFYIQDCLPGDTHTLSNDIQAYQMPLEVPVTNRITLYTQYFFCPYRILWKHFKPFIQGGRYGDYEPETPKFKGGAFNTNINQYNQDAIDSYMLPDEQTAKAIISLSKSFTPAIGPIRYSNTIKYSLGKYTPLDYMGLPLPEGQLQFSSTGNANIGYFPMPIFSEKAPMSKKENNKGYYNIDAMPLMAFQRIYRDYYLNQHINKDWFGFDDIDDWTLQDGSQNYFEFENQAGQTKRIYLNKPRYVDWSKDYFTTALTSPFLGSQPKINQEIEWEKMFRNPSDAVTEITEDALAPYDYLFQARRVPGSTQTQQNIKTKTEEYIKTFKKATITNSGITLENIRLLSALTMQLENQAKIDGNYEEYLRVTYGISPKKNELDMPLYIGGTTQPIIVQSVIQTSESTQNSSLGQMAGKGVTSNNGYIGKFTATEPGIIMGIMHILPETIYATQGIEKEWTRETRYDYPMPAFEGLGMEGILNREIYCMENSNQTYNIDDLFAYQNRNDSYRNRKNIITTNMRYTNELYWNAWTQKRRFENIPTLTNDFLQTGKITQQTITGDTNIIFSGNYPKSAYTKEVNHGQQAGQMEIIYNKFEPNIEEYMYTAPTEPHFIIKAWNGDRAIRPIPKKASNNYL